MPYWRVEFVAITNKSDIFIYTALLARGVYNKQHKEVIDEAFKKFIFASSPIR